MEPKKDVLDYMMDEVFLPEREGWIIKCKTYEKTSQQQFLTRKRHQIN
jgi:hypothetical protein